MTKILNDAEQECEINKSELTIKLNESIIQFKSAENDTALRGEAVDFMVIDEMAYIKKDVYELAIKGTIALNQSPVLFIGTPNGKNVFFDLYMTKNKLYKSFNFTSKDNPNFDIDEWNELKNTLPERVFQQEFEAKFIDSGGMVFRGVNECIAGELEEPKPNVNYYAGVDLAKTVDYTVIIILDEGGHLVAYDRFNQISWNVQKRRIIELCSRYNCMTIVDATGVGDPILEDLQNSIPVHGLKFTNQTKKDLIENLILKIEQGQISYPEIPELIHELNIFTYSQTSTGLIRYSAPVGYHDDIVIALALAVQGLPPKKISFDSIGGRIAK